MAHELTIRETGKVEMAYVGEKPWHSLGDVLQRGADIDTWKRAAGMDWTVERAPVQYAHGGKTRVVNTSHVVFRSDNGDHLGVVSNRYHLVQPGDALEFFRDLVGPAGFSLETAGTLFGGKQYWALAHIGEDAMIIGKKDKVKGYLLLSTACDGSMATRVRFTTVRVVCNNTLQMAYGSKSDGEVQVRHSTRFNPADVKDRLGIARDTFHTFAAQMRKLAGVKIDEAKAGELVSAALLEWAPEIGADKVRETKGWRSMIALFNGAGVGADVAGQTGWGLVNAGTEFVDHVMASKAASNRMYNAMFGKGNELKNILARRVEEAVLV